MVQHGPLVASTELRRGENDSVEGNVILAHELVQADVLGVVPPLLPLICVVCSDGDVTNAGVEPDVQDLLVVTGQRNLCAPLQVAGDTSGLETFLQPRVCDVDTVGRPCTLLARLCRPLLNLCLQLVQKQINVFCLSCDGSCAIKLAAGLLQLQRVEQMATLVALVSSCILVGAQRALSLDKAVGQEGVVCFAVRLDSCLFLQEAVVVEFCEDVLCNVCLLGGGSATENVEANVEPFVDFRVQLVVLVTKLFRCALFLDGLGLCGSSVLVGTANEEGGEAACLAVSATRKSVMSARTWLDRD
jgi:hypothetical protein